MLKDGLKLQGITDLAMILCEQNNFAEVLRIVCQKATGLFAAESAFLMLANPRTGQTVKTIFKEGGGIARRALSPGLRQRGRLGAALPAAFFER